MVIRHPSIDPDEISRTLARAPYQSWQAGQPRRTPTGRPMPSIGRESYWVWSTTIAGQRNFFAALMDELGRLSAHGAFLRAIAESGGQIALEISLPGAENIGATLPHDAIRRLATLPVELGVEVFPKMN